MKRHKMTNHLTGLLLALAMLLSLLAPAYGQDSGLECFDQRWPHEHSDLKPDPSIRFGRLDNGFRYAIMENDTPRDRVAMYFHVNVGSIHENEAEKGYAHYLEHMLFNGTENFPPGELINYFQSIGMSFGADTNAFTSYDQTVYTIVLPQGTKEDVKKGLLVLSDYARGALLLEEEVESERGIILAEKLARDSVSYRMQVASRENALQGTLLAEREPIGEVETINNASAESLRNFYDKWYRPENMTLVIVGDVDAGEVEGLVASAFAQMKGEGPKPQCPALGDLERKGVRSFYYYEPDRGDVQVSLESYWNKDKEKDSYRNQVERLQEYMAMMILQKRLVELAESETELLSRPQAYSGELLNLIGFAGLSASTTQEKWRESLTALDNSLRQALAYGITEEEIDIARKDLIAYFTTQAQKMQGRESTTLARQIVHTLNEGDVFQSPLQERELYVPALASFTVKEINDALLRLLDRDERLIEATGNLQLPSTNAREIVLDAYRESRSQPVSRYSKKKHQPFPYAAAGERAEPSRHEQHDDIAAETFYYDNGVILNLKKTDFRKNHVEMLVEFGPGQQAEPIPGLAMLAQSVIDESGSGKLTKTAIRDALAGSSISYRFGIDKTRFAFSGTALKEEAGLLLRTLHTLFKDPGLRENAYRNSMVRYRQAYEQMASDINGADNLYFKRFFAGGNTLFGMPPWEEVAALTLPQIKEWVTPIFAESIPHISVVGDFDKEEILDVIGTYFGSLPTGATYVPEEEKIDFPTGKQLEVPVPSKIGKSLVVFGWQTEGFGDIGVVRRLGMLASVFEERIRVSIREKLGISYSPTVYNTSSRFIPEYGVIYARLIVDNANIEAVKEAVLDISRDLQRQPVQEDELMRVRLPLLTQLKDTLRTNDYWLDTVLFQSALYPRQLQWPTTIIEDNASITAAEMTDYARKYLQPEKAAFAVARPVLEENG